MRKRFFVVWVNRAFQGVWGGSHLNWLATVRSSFRTMQQDSDPEHTVQTRQSRNFYGKMFSDWLNQSPELVVGSKTRLKTNPPKTSKKWSTCLAGHHQRKYNAVLICGLYLNYKIKLWDHVYKMLQFRHSSTNVDVIFLKLKVNVGTLISESSFHCKCARVQSQSNKECVAVLAST